MIEQVPTTIKVSGPEGIIVQVIPTAVSEQFSNDGVHEVHIEWSTSDGAITGTVLTTPLHLTETLDKGGFFEPASLYKHYANQPKFNPEGGYSAYNQTYNLTHPQPKADLSQIAADLAKLPAVTTPKKKPGPKMKVSANAGKLFLGHDDKPIGKVTDMKMTTGGVEVEAKLNAAIANVWGIPIDMITLDEQGPISQAEVAEHVMRLAARQAAETLYHGLANAKDFLPIDSTLNGVQHVELGGHKYDILLTLKHKEEKS